jgi:hypothetical protein
MRVLLASLFVTSVAGLTSCSSDPAPATQVTLSLHSDVDIPKDFDRVRILVRQAGQLRYDLTYEAGTELLIPGTIAIAAGDDRASPVTVEIRAFVDQAGTDPEKIAPRVLRRARFSFIEGRSLLLRMPLRFSCFDRSDCGEGRTCAGGACVPADVDATTLPTFTPSLVFGPEVATNGAGCFDTRSCLPKSVRVARTADRDRCVFELPAGVDAGRVTVALERIVSPTKSKIGFCDAELCRVALDQDDVEGWSFDGDRRDRIVLSAGLCERLGEGHFDGVAAVDACGTKRADVPDCQELAAATGKSLAGAP